MSIQQTQLRRVSRRRRDDPETDLGPSLLRLSSWCVAWPSGAQAAAAERVDADGAHPLDRRLAPVFGRERMVVALRRLGIPPVHCAPGARRNRNGDCGEGHRVLLVGLGRPLRLLRVDVHASGRRHRGVSHGHLSRRGSLWRRSAPAPSPSRSTPTGRCGAGRAVAGRAATIAREFAYGRENPAFVLARHRAAARA